MADYEEIFKAYDIRGIVGEQLDAAACRAIGGGFARYVKAGGSGRVVIGRDMRPSGEELSEAFAAGVLEHGLDVIDIGLCATDMMYFASGWLAAPGAVFTASHNPAEYNGIKLCGTAAAPIGSETGLADIKAMALSGPDPAASPGSWTSREVLDDYIAHVTGFVDRASLRPMKLVVDTANGMGGLTVPPLFEGLPFEFEHLYPELDGTFPNHPADPMQPENLKDLQAALLTAGADAGLAFDGDADRVFLVDEKARPLSGSLTAALLARSFLKRRPGATIVHNLICSRAVTEIITEAGGRAVRSRVGHSFMKQLMASTGAVFGGEHSGHYYFRDNYGADSGLIVALLVLELLSSHEGTLSELVAPLDRYAASGEINSRVSDPEGTIERVARAFGHARQDRLDGLSVDCGDWWFNLRPSNTEPLLRLNLEAAGSSEVAARVAEVMALYAPSETARAVAPGR